MMNNSDTSPIAELTSRQWQKRQAQVLELIDQIGALLPHIDDELICWLITYLHSAGGGRPHDPRDPWSVLLRSLTPELGQPGVPQPPAVKFVWAELVGHCARVETLQGKGARFRIVMHHQLGRAQRRVSLAHELAHVAIGKFWTDATPLDVIREGEAEADRVANERFDIDAVVPAG
jgi:hypothetical protein